MRALLGIAVSLSMEASFAQARILPACFHNRTAYAADVSLACRRASHFSLLAEKVCRPYCPSYIVIPANAGTQCLAASSYVRSRFRVGRVLARVFPRPGRLRSGRFEHLPISESLSLLLAHACA